MATILCVRCGREAAGGTGLPPEDALCWGCIDRERARGLEPVAPLLAGGQGRQAQEVEASAWALVGAALLVLSGAFVLALLYLVTS